MAENYCKTCAYFRSMQIMGVCRRFPEQHNKHETDWCGEHTIRAIEVLPLKVYDITTDQVTEKRRGRKPKNAETAA
ncbi:hypothetical protein EBZ39_02020 [bacterium]|nr:hypothetical protein [bacterium]